MLNTIQNCNSKSCLNVNFRNLWLHWTVKFNFLNIYIVNLALWKFYQNYSMLPFYFMFARLVKVVYKEIRRNLPIYMQEPARTKSVPFILHKTRTPMYISVQIVYISHANSLYKPCRWLFTRLIKSRSCKVYDPLRMHRLFFVCDWSRDISKLHTPSVWTSGVWYLIKGCP